MKPKDSKKLIIMSNQRSKNKTVQKYLTSAPHLQGNTLSSHHGNS